MSEQFDEQGNSFETDDVEAHRISAHPGSDLDTEGHQKRADQKRSDIELEEDDVEGHQKRADQKRSDIELEEDLEGHRLSQLDGVEDDVEGHQKRADQKRSDIELGDEDDVEGHLRSFGVQPPRDADNQGNQF